MMKLPIITILISILMVVLYTVFGSAPESLIWLAESPFDQTWRLVSAHFVHSDGQHLAWNLGAFILLGAIVEAHSKRDLLVSIGVGVIAVNVYLLSFYELTAYAGLSGVLNSILVVALFHLCQYKAYRAAAMWTMILSMIKIIYELYSGHTVFSSIAWTAVPQAHLAGWLIGGAFVSLQSIRRFKIQRFSLYKMAIKV